MTTERRAVSDDSSTIGEYTFESIANFDARRGYTRCVLPGVGTSFQDGQSGTIDLWRDRAGNVVARFSSQGYAFSFMVTHSSGEQLTDAQVEAFENLLGKLLMLWLIEGVDDTPSTYASDLERYSL